MVMNSTGSTSTAPMSTAVECLWADWSVPFYQTVSSESLQNLLGAVGKHLALGIYELKHNLVATPSTLHVMMESNEDPYSKADVKLALTFAANPSILDITTVAEKEALVGMKLLVLNQTTATYEATPFPPLHRTDCFDPVSLRITIQPPLEDEEDPLVTYMKQNPTYVPTYIESKRLAPIEAKEADNPSIVGVGWLNTRSLISETTEPWYGTSGGRKFVRGRGGVKSRIHWMVAEICRQVYRGYYKVGSVSAFNAEVLTVVDCDREDREINALIDLVVTGGQPQDQRMLEFLESRHLLS